MIFKLDEHDISFPDPGKAEADGLLAVGGDLSPQRLMTAYGHGIFPWYSDSPILWYSPHDRFVLFPDKIKVSKSMRQLMKSGVFTFTFNRDFKSVIKACAAIPRIDQPGTWINPDMEQAYIHLHTLGFAHSVEVWSGQELAGGLYGVSVAGIFCGESMFSKISNASKAGLIWLCQNKKYRMIDCQIYSRHLEGMGSELISREEYIENLGKTV